MSLREMDLSICIVSLNAGRYLRECLQSVLNCRGALTIEVIVVDNGSDDGTLTMIREFLPQIVLVRNSRNVGFARATNQALERSRGRFVMWLNNDTVVHSGALGSLVEFLVAHPDVGVAGPMVLNRNGTLQRQCRRRIPTPLSALLYFLQLDWPWRGKQPGLSYLVYGEDLEVREVDAVSGACLVARRELVDEIGGLDETFFAYGEDLDWCLRAKKAGWKVYYFPGAAITHYGGQGGSAHQPLRSIYQFHRAMWVFYRKHLRSRYNPVLSLLVWLGIAFRCALAIGVSEFTGRPLIGSRKG